MLISPNVSELQTLNTITKNNMTHLPCLCQVSIQNKLLKPWQSQRKSITSRLCDAVWCDQTMLALSGAQPYPNKHCVDTWYAPSLSKRYDWFCKDAWPSLEFLHLKTWNINICNMYYILYYPRVNVSIMFHSHQVADLNLAVASSTLLGFLSGWCRKACCSGTWAMVNKCQPSSGKLCGSWHVQMTRILVTTCAKNDDFRLDLDALPIKVTTKHFQWCLWISEFLCSWHPWTEKMKVSFESFMKV